MTKVALVTGGQQGIGLGIAKCLVAKGYHVAIAALPVSDDPKVTSALKELGPNSSYYQFDVKQTEKISYLLDQIQTAYGTITSLISNAGITAKIRGDMLDISQQNFQDVLDVNLTGGFFLAQEVGRRMVGTSSKHYRSMVFITSVSAEIVSIERAEYCLSKAAASMMSKLFATRLAAHDIGVFEVRPGIIATEMTVAVHDKYTPRIESKLVPAKRWGYPEDIGQVVVPMVEGDMRFSTGSVVFVDGGLSIPRL